MKKQPVWLAWWLFWLSVASFVYVYALFPALTLLFGWLFPKPVRHKYDEANEADWPSLTLLIAAYNEAEVIQAKLENSVGLRYPAGKIEIVVASDGSEDGTNEIVAAFADERVRLLALPRLGKNQVLNTAVPQTHGDILVMTDADSMMADDALIHLVAPFADPSIGGTAGDYHYVAAGNKGTGERTYWDFDRLIKEMQSQSGNVIGATGQIYAVRRELFSPVPPSVTDDAYISRSAIANHQRLLFVPTAVATGPVADSAGEYRRKVRITTRGLNTVWQQRYLLNPFTYGAYAWQLFSHKVLRRLMGIPLFLLALTAPLLWSRGWLYKLATIGQVAFHSLALLGFLGQGKTWGRKKVITLPFHFNMIYVAALQGAFNLVRGRRFDVWQAERGGSATPDTAVHQPNSSTQEAV